MSRKISREEYEYMTIIKKFGRDYSWWDIPTYIRKREKDFEPIDKTVPYEKYMNNPSRNKGENRKQFMDRQAYVFSQRVAMGVEED